MELKQNLTATNIDGEVLPSTEPEFVHDIMRAVNKNRGRVRGHCLLLLLDDGEGGTELETSRSWPSKVHLVGALQVLSADIAKRFNAGEA